MAVVPVERSDRFRLLAFQRRHVLEQVAVACLYLATSLVSAEAFRRIGCAPIFWPASGLALGVLLVRGVRPWPSILLGATAYQLMAGEPAAIAIALACGDVLGPLAGWWLLHRVGHFDTDLTTVQGYIRLVVIGALGGELIHAAIETTTFLLAGRIVPQVATAAAVMATTDDILGIILVTPLVLVWRKVPTDWTDGARVAEAVALVGLTALVGQVVFLDWFHDPLGAISRGYWMYLFITLGAVRLGRHGVLIILLMTFGQAVVGAVRHTGFFATDIAETGLMNLWFYTIILSVVGMASAVLLRQRDAAELTLRTTIDKLKSTNSELEQFAYVASHDLREPLRMISSYIALLDRRYGARLDADGHEYIAFARDGAQRLDRMVLDLLEFSRVGRCGDPFAPLALAEVLQTAVANLVVAIDEAGAEVTISSETSMIIGSRSELVRLVQNLIENALKYRHPGRPPKIAMSVEAKPAEWVVAIADNGIGIASEYFDRIFVIFQRLHTREKYGGTGIGLAICRRIVQFHGGRIWLESVPDLGCTFFFSLPRPERN